MNVSLSSPVQRRVAWWLGAGLLLICITASLLMGARHIAPSTVWQALTSTCPVQQTDCVIIQEARLPRTLIGVMVGASLGLAGCLMQQLTRNPLADPGVLGINAGASLGVVLCAAWGGISSMTVRVSAAFIGALIASSVLIVLGALTGRGRINPIRLTLIGVAMGASLEGIASGIALLDPTTFDQMRFWRTGSLDIHGMTAPYAVAIPMLIGLVIVVIIGRGLEALALGEQLAASLGSRTRVTQSLGIVAIALLCGSAVAAVGPIAFLGLMAPHLSSHLSAGSARWQLYWSLIVTPLLLLSADIAGRVLFVGEIRVSILTAAVGAPMLILLARKLWRGAS